MGRGTNQGLSMCVCVCVCVFVGERERELLWEDLSSWSCMYVFMCSDAHTHSSIQHRRPTNQARYAPHAVPILAQPPLIMCRIHGRAQRRDTQSNESSFKCIFFAFWRHMHWNYRGTNGTATRESTQLAWCSYNINNISVLKFKKKMFDHCDGWR